MLPPLSPPEEMFPGEDIPAVVQEIHNGATGMERTLDEDLEATLQDDRDAESADAASDDDDAEPAGEVPSDWGDTNQLSTNSGDGVPAGDLNDPEMSSSVRRTLQQLSNRGVPPPIMPGATRKQTRAAQSHVAVSNNARKRAARMEAPTRTTTALATTNRFAVLQGLSDSEHSSGTVSERRARAWRAKSIRKKERQKAAEQLAHSE